MTWIVIIAVILTSIIKILITCLPLGAVEWIQSKFEIHTKLAEENAIMTIGGKEVIGDAKSHFITEFNNAIFMEKQHVYPGNEDNFINRNDMDRIIDHVDAKKTYRLYVFQYPDRVDVVKKYKKNLVAYSLFADKLHNLQGVIPTN